MNYLKSDLEGRPVLAQLERKIANRTSDAGSRREEVFTRQFLCPRWLSTFANFRLRWFLPPRR